MAIKLNPVEHAGAHRAYPEISAPMGKGVVYLELFLGAVHVEFTADQARRLSYLFEQAADRAEDLVVEQSDTQYTTRERI